MSPHLGVDQELGMLEIGKPKKEDALPVVSPDLELRRKTVKVSFFLSLIFHERHGTESHQSYSWGLDPIQEDL